VICADETRSGIVVAVFLRIAMLLLLAAGALAVLIPAVGSTAGVVAVIVIAVVVIGFVIFIWSQGGSAFQGGWRGRGPMG
jgi:Mg/Co/Ni transporter MgtE